MSRLNRDAPHDPYAVLRLPNFRRFCAANVLASFATAILSVLIGWDLYERTRSPLILGLVGLVQIIPNLVLAIPAGHYVDRNDPRRVAAVALGLEGAATALIALVSWQRGPLWITFLALFIVGVGRAIKNPTYAPLISGVTEPDLFQNASSWNGGADHTAAIIGPAVGGLVAAGVGHSAPIFAACAVLLFLAMIAMLSTQIQQRQRSTEDLSKDALLAGARFIRKSPIMLGAITLDMFGCARSQPKVAS
ncbi:MAG TPA: MFS transporter, partial [Thermomicrobiales bacterium]|nr:MFS transporter [Thermomicrobiales bacterium]